MLEISRLNGGSESIELYYVEGKATPTDIMELAINLDLGGLSLSNTVSILDSFCVDRARSTIHN
jgi:transposase-like protein